MDGEILTAQCWDSFGNRVIIGSQLSPSNVSLGSLRKKTSSVISQASTRTAEEEEKKVEKHQA